MPLPAHLAILQNVIPITVLTLTNKLLFTKWGFPSPALLFFVHQAVLLVWLRVGKARGWWDFNTDVGLTKAEPAAETMEVDEVTCSDGEEEEQRDVAETTVPAMCQGPLRLWQAAGMLVQAGAIGLLAASAAYATGTALSLLPFQMYQTLKQLDLAVVAVVERLVLGVQRPFGTWVSLVVLSTGVCIGSLQLMPADAVTPTGQEAAPMTATSSDLNPENVAFGTIASLGASLLGAFSKLALKTSLMGKANAAAASADKQAAVSAWAPPSSLALRYATALLSMPVFALLAILDVMAIDTHALASFDYWGSLPILILNAGFLAPYALFSYFLLVDATSMLTYQVVGPLKYVIASFTAVFVFSKGLTQSELVGGSLVVMASLAYASISSHVATPPPPTTEKGEQGDEERGR
jgi:hypothetical protein